MEKQTELVIGIGAGLGGCILGVVFVIIALLCRKHLSDHVDTRHRRRKYVPYYHELSESRNNSIKSRKSACGPSMFENNAFTIEETSFSRPYDRQIGNFSSFVPNSRSSTRDLRDISLPSNHSAARQQDTSGNHGNQIPSNQQSSVNTDHTVFPYSKPNKNSVYVNTITEVQSNSDRGAKNRLKVKDRDNDGSLYNMQMQQISDNAPGNRNSFISLISSDDISRYSLPRLSVRRSENYVDVTGASPYTSASFTG